MKKLTIFNEDRIVYTLVSKGGGVDGKDHTDKGGQITAASFERKALENHEGSIYSTIVPMVVNTKDRLDSVLKKLDPIDLLILSLVLTNSQ